MATATAVLTLNPVVSAVPAAADETQKLTWRYGTCALSGGGTYATLGIPLNWQFTAADGAKSIVLSDQLQPMFAQFFSQSGGTYQYNYDTTHNTLRIIQGGTELANGAAITADTIGFEARFLRGV